MQDKKDFQVFVFDDKGSPVFVNLSLIYHGKTYNFSFIFHTRENKDDFKATYPLDLFPPDNSIEIQICEIPAEIESDDCDSIHVVTNIEWPPLERYVCHYPGANYEEALRIAKFWAKYNLRRVELGSKSTDPEEINSFKLDQDIRVLVIS
jgi:hypothetical protein